jgi:hypothetical protein
MLLAVKVEHVKEWKKTWRGDGIVFFKKYA